MKMYLCKPCSLGVVADGKKVKQLSGRTDKITCAKCGKRRFGAEYDVTEKIGGKKHE